MDHAPNNEPSSSETTADNGDEPSAAHFREAARLAAARVRAAMAGMPDETEKSDEPAPLKPPSAKAMEAVARKRARSLAGRAERDRRPMRRRQRNLPRTEPFLSHSRPSAASAAVPPTTTATPSTSTLIPSTSRHVVSGYGDDEAAAALRLAATLAACRQWRPQTTQALCSG